MRLDVAEGAPTIDAMLGWAETPAPPSVRGQIPRLIGAPSAPNHVAPPSTPAGTPGGDDQLGAIFRQMRMVIGAGEPALARMLGTDISVVMDLEAGVTDGLPAWPHLVRIVERYAALSGVDPSPILTRLMQRSMQHPQALPPAASARPLLADRPTDRAMIPAVRAPVPVERSLRHTQLAALTTAITAVPRQAPLQRVAPPPVTAKPQSSARKQIPVQAPSPPSPDDAAASVAVAPPPSRRLKRRLIRGAMPAVLLALAIAGYLALPQLPRVAYASIALFPARLQEPVRNIVDLVVMQTAAIQDGLRWIDLADPRLRKGDRLKAP